MPRILIYLTIHTNPSDSKRYLIRGHFIPLVWGIDSSQETRMETRDLNELDRHPVNEEIYRDEELPSDFVDSIEEHGVREPVVITGNDTIISGHRRVEAARRVGKNQIKVRVEPFNSDLEEREAVVHYNKQRSKTFSQKMREALELEKIERKRAKERQGTRTDLADEDSNVSQKFARSEIEEPGSTRERVASHIDVSGETYRKAKAVWVAAQDGISRLEREVKKIDNGDQSIHGAYKELQRWEKLEELENAVDWDTITKAGVFPKIEKRKNTFEDSQNQITEKDSWIESLRLLKDRYESEFTSPKQGDTYTFMYLLEAKGSVDLSNETPGGTSITDRKPGAEELESDYWGGENIPELDLQEMAIKYGVHEELIKYWLREEGVFLKKQEFSEPARNRIERV